MIDLATWNLSIPEGAPPATIQTSQLVQGFKNQYFNSDTGTVFFWVPVTGATTANAIYPRSELRETYADGRLRNWTYPEADNFLHAGLRVSQVPSTGRQQRDGPGDLLVQGGDGACRHQVALGARRAGRGDETEIEHLDEVVAQTEAADVQVRRLDVAVHET